MERAAAPLSLGGWSGLCPTQELVDAYEMADGTTPILGYNADGSPIINSESGYSEEGFTEEADAEGYYPENTFNMFVDREPRFYATVTYSGATGEDVRLISVWELLMDVLVDLTIQLLVI